MITRSVSFTTPTPCPCCGEPCEFVIPRESLFLYPGSDPADKYGDLSAAQAALARVSGCAIYKTSFTSPGSLLTATPGLTISAFTVNVSMSASAGPSDGTFSSAGFAVKIGGLRAGDMLTLSGTFSGSFGGAFGGSVVSA